MSSESNGYEGWAVVELMGHRRLIGRVSEATIAGAPMLRIDVLTSDGEATQFYGANAIYCLTPTDEATARAAAVLSTVAPITRWELPRLPAPIGQSDDDRAADVAEFLERYTSGALALDNDVLDRLDTAIEQAAFSRVEDNDADDDGFHL